MREPSKDAGKTSGELPKKLSGTTSQSVQSADESDPDQPRTVLFGEWLRSNRLERNIALFEVARQTRIPVRSLERLEAGAFERLPADIFVRGFLRSYADTVGLDRDQVLDRYIELGLKRQALQADLVVAARRRRDGRDDPTLLPAPAADRDTRATRAKQRTILPRLSDSEKEGRRGPVTVAVIILVIVATLDNVVPPPWGPHRIRAAILLMVDRVTN